MDYLIPLVNRGVPVIFGFNHLAQLFGLRSDVLARIVHSPENFYRSFSIPRHSGGKRPISAPYPSLLRCQKWVDRNINRAFQIEDSCFAYSKGKSIYLNALAHCGSEAVLKIDFENFFSSIGQGRIIGLFRSLGYTNRISYYLSQVCCLNGSLPQGGGASPTLSNIACRRLDRRLAGLARRKGIGFTRYADDITFSGDEEALGIIPIVRSIASEEGFSLNEAKTRLLKRGQRIIVTGLDISTGSPRPTKEYRRKIEKEVHYIWRYGLSGHVNSEKLYDPLYVMRLKGRLDFWASIEPQHPRLKRAVLRFQSSASEYLASL